jgi:protease IV
MSSRTLAGMLVLALAVVAVAVLAVGSGGGERRGPSEQVVLIELSGPIVDARSGFMVDAITPRLVRERLAAAAANPRVGAVILRVNSPGGTVAASQEIAALIASHPDPVVVSIGDTAASGGYYIASAADAIIAQPGSQTGSIGVILTVLDYSELLEELGVRFDVVTSGEHKDMFLPGRLDDERRGLLQVQSDQYYAQFVDAVAHGRGMDTADVRALATGEVFTGEQALALGLVDELGGVAKALEVAAELAGLDDPVLVERQPGLFEQLMVPGGFAVRLQDLLSPGDLLPLPSLEQRLERLIAPVPDVRFQP